VAGSRRTRQWGRGRTAPSGCRPQPRHLARGIRFGSTRGPAPSTMVLIQEGHASEQRTHRHHAQRAGPDICAIVCRSGRILPSTEHDEACGRRAPSPTAHGHGSRPSRPGPPSARTPAVPQEQAQTSQASQKHQAPARTPWLSNQEVAPQAPGVGRLAAGAGCRAPAAASGGTTSGDGAREPGSPGSPRGKVAHPARGMRRCHSRPGPFDMTAFTAFDLGEHPTWTPP
jgi:hypothetical protein